MNDIRIVKPADIIIELDGSVWVSLEPPSARPSVWPSYVELEEIQSEDFDCARAARHGRPSYRRSPRDSRKPDPFSFSRDRFDESKYGIRDHRPMNPQYAEQARLYTESMGYKVDPDIWRNLFK